MDPKKTTLAELIDAFVAADRPAPLASLGALALGLLARRAGRRPVVEITADEVDAARRLRSSRAGACDRCRGKAANRDRQAAEARHRQSLLQRSRRALPVRATPARHSAHARLTARRTRARAASRSIPERYFRDSEEVERLIAVARVVDQRWRRLAVLIRLAYVTGLRRGNLMALRWSRCRPRGQHRASVNRTKNGSPLIVPIPESVAAELRAPAAPVPDALVFEGRAASRTDFANSGIRSVARRDSREEISTSLRHGCATALARAACNQAQLMTRSGIARCASTRDTCISTSTIGAP